MNKHKEEIEGYEKKKKEISKKIEEQEESIKNVKNDRDLYRDLNSKEQKNRNDNKFLIENQRKIIENIANIPSKSPKRPTSHYISKASKS